MVHPLNEIEKALNTLELPPLITRDDIKRQYRFLAKKRHPDVGGSLEKMEQLNRAYAILMKYIEEFRYTFDEEEISKQFPGVNHAQKYR